MFSSRAIGLNLPFVSSKKYTTSVPSSFAELSVELFNVELFAVPFLFVLLFSVVFFLLRSSVHLTIFFSIFDVKL